MIKRYAEIDQDNIVLRIINADSKEWCEQNLGGRWVKTHDPLDAGIGYTYDSNEDKFIQPIEEEIVEEIND
jgi:hypothetical protein